MKEADRSVRITSLIVMAVGVALLALTIVTGGAVNVALPLVFLVLGGIFFILVYRLRQQWKWAPFLFIPGALLLAFGFIFLLNVLTQDWNSWAYAWLLLVSGLGVGLVLANHPLVWHPLLPQIGWGLALAGITFFAIFGAIAGGALIQIAAPVLLVLAGLSLHWLRADSLPSPLFNILRLSRPTAAAAELPTPRPPEALVENLSSRELEVLRLIDSGLTNQQIADALSVAPSTVKTHINNIYGKMGVQTRVQAVNRARELGLLEK